MNVNIRRGDKDEEIKKSRINTQRIRSRRLKKKLPGPDSSLAINPGPPFGVTLFGGLESLDSALKVVIRAIRNPRRSVKKSSATGGTVADGAPVNNGRWPLDLVGGGYGMLALRVRPQAGLERYGLLDNDLIVIDVGDLGGDAEPNHRRSGRGRRAGNPTDGEPAFAAINNQVIIGLYHEGSRGRITIIPFIDKMVPVVAAPSEIQVVCALRAIAHRDGPRLQPMFRIR
ncbi:MAG: hypothetical protein ACREDR_39825 [Blastocatellia bacterium]